MESNNLFITGGAGYVGSVLVRQLLELDYKVTVWDILYYGADTLPTDNPNLDVIQGDIRDTAKMKEAMQGHDAVIHLACISNDASFELDEELSTSVNLDAFEPMVVAAKEVGIRRFIYASTSSVYGVSDSPDVTEEHPLVPLTLYNKFKGMCEPLLFKHTDEKLVGVIFRPATVCGYSPRQRLDVSVNILTNQALNTGKIKVFGGSQLRPNLHIQDYCDLCNLLLTAPTEKVANEIFNCGIENMSIMEIALLVKSVVEENYPEVGKIEIKTTSTDDIRSYHINSDKIKRVLGFAPSHTVAEAINDLCEAFRNGKLQDSFENDNYYNVRKMKSIGAS